MGLFSTIVNGFNEALTYLDDAKDLLNGSLESNEYKELKDLVTDNTSFLDSGRFVSQDEILRRFHLGNEFQSDSKNEVFTSGFEDPTRLMFKVEFGDWGNSLLDLETIKNQLVTSKSSNVYFEDYDQYPMGLLDLDFREFKNENDWNLQTSYNAYNYLMNNNEDARAQYIQQFIKGIYIIQKDMPYIFQSISGLDKLLDINTIQGKRLKDVQLTLKCLEGLDLKVRTLLELYRKAAYDDVWQRWILPDIYRYFRMIIYVFDRRILHTGVGTYSTDQDYFPIYAFECGPCEFNIAPTIDNEYSVDWSNHKNAESQIIINVKNVKTYFSNRLLNKIDTLTHKVNWISDFNSVGERHSYKVTDSDNHVNFRTRWMRRMFMTPSEYKAYYNNVTHKFGGLEDFNVLYGTNEIYGPIIPKNTWHNAVVTDPIYTIDSWDGLKKYFKKLLLTRTTLIRDSRTDDKDIMQNTLDRPYMPLYDYNPDMVMYGNFTQRALELMRTHIRQMLLRMLNSTYLIDSSVYYKIKDPGLINNYDKHEITMVNDTSMYLDKPQHEFIKPIFDEYKPTMTMENNTSMYLGKPHHEFVKPIINDTKHTMTMENNTSMYLGKPHHEFVKPVFDEYKPTMNMQNNTSMYLDIPEHDFIYPEFNLDKTIMDMIEPEFNLDKPGINFIRPYIDNDKNDMNLIPTEIDETKAGLTYVVPEFDEHKSSMNLIPDNQDTYKSSMNLIPDELDEHKAKLSLIEDEHDNHKAKLSLISDEQDNHKVTLSLISDEHDNHKAKLSLIEDEHDNHKAKLNLISDEHDEHKSSMNLIPDNQDTHKSDMNLIPDNQDTHKSDMNLIPDNLDNHKSSMNLIPDYQDTHKSSMNLISDEQDVHKAHMNLLSDSQDTHKANMNLLKDIHDIRKGNTQMIPQTIDEHKPNIDMIRPLINPSIANMEFIQPFMNTSIAKMDFVYPTMNTSVAEMDFIYPDMNSSLPDMKFIYPDMNSSIPDMKFIYPDMNSSIPNMKFIEPVMNTSLADMKFVEPILNVSLADMKFIEPILNTSISEMTFITPDMNSSIPNMKFVEPIYNTSVFDMTFINPDMNASLPNMTFVYPDMNSSLPGMEFVYPDMNTSLSDMIMVKPNMDSSIPNIPMVRPDQNTILPQHDMVEPISNTSLPKMEFTKPIYDKSKQDMLMTIPVINSSKPEMDMIRNILDTDKINMDMVTLVSNDEKPRQLMLILETSVYDVNMSLFNNYVNSSLPEMKMTDNKLNSSLPEMKMTDNISHDNYKPDMKMVELTQDTSLVKKLMALTQIDVNDLKTTDIENLLSLADIIENTVELIKEHSQNMKLTENKPEIPKHVHMKMTRIPLPERRQFIVDKLHKVDLEAIDRAWEAKKNAESSDDRVGTKYSTTGSYGTAL